MAPDLALDADVQINAPLTERLACFMHDLAPELLKAVCNRLVVPTDCKDPGETLFRASLGFGLFHSD